MKYQKYLLIIGITLFAYLIFKTDPKTNNLATLCFTHKACNLSIFLSIIFITQKYDLFALLENVSIELDQLMTAIK